MESKNVVPSGDGAAASFIKSFEGVTIKIIEYEPVAVVIDQRSEVDGVSRHRSSCP